MKETKNLSALHHPIVDWICCEKAIAVIFQFVTLFEIF